jgi:hypothetical protein
MFIPIGIDYTSVQSGSVIKIVHCEGCKQDYVYKLERTATGEGMSFCS